MQEVYLDYGDGKMRIELPESATVVRYGQTYSDPPAIDNTAATRQALAQPLGFAPLKDLSGPDKKIVIGFPDRVKGGVHATCHRKVAIPLIIEALLDGGAKLENITLVCGMGLHRKNNLEEWYWYLGKDIVDRFYPDRLVNHDGESPDLLDFGQDAMGNRVLCNRMLAEADLPILVGHCSGNPYGGYSGGYKMLVTGFTGWKSIASHHCPSTMHRDDWLGASPHGHMRTQFKSIGQSIEAHIGKKIFGVDAVLDQHSNILAVAAGGLAEVESATWPVADQRTNIHLDTPPADVLVFGLPRNFHYGPGMGTNPILMSLAIGGQLSRCWNAFREGGVIIAASLCDGWFNDHWFPSYQETYAALQGYCTPREFLESSDMEKIANNYDYCWQYSNRYTYHPFHAMSMISGGAVPALRTSAVLMPGAMAPEYARGMGFTPLSSFEEAMQLAQKYVGKNPRILCTPECFTGGVPVHLHGKK